MENKKRDCWGIAVSLFQSKRFCFAHPVLSQARMYLCYYEKHYYKRLNREKVLMILLKSISVNINYRIPVLLLFLAQLSEIAIFAMFGNVCLSEGYVGIEYGLQEFRQPGTEFLLQYGEIIHFLF